MDVVQGDASELCALECSHVALDTDLDNKECICINATY